MLDIFRSSDILQVLDELSEGRILWFFDNIDGNDVMRAILSIRDSSFHKSSHSTRNLDSLSGGSFGYSKRFDTINGGAFGTSKRNFDEIDNVGFNGFAKRNMDEIDNAGFRGYIKRYDGASGHPKRNLHKTDHAGFNGLFKR
ncbi:orcokinin peptides type A-like [Limulus polyphemus]|uniref:Orcokinin peptides type A-like n=1 Tax=Limulus polyphemus TaxID=6850 RepID=A0ABM1BSJ4_LIMPO|nr:orcokinin peptides type A-like [Limulus polyphemus]